MARNVQIEEGCTVVYIARKITDDIPTQIYSIKSIAQENWNFEKTIRSAAVTRPSNKKQLPTQEKWIIGMVKSIKRGDIEIETNDGNIGTLQVELSSIDCTFMPMVGDDVSVLCICEKDELSQNSIGLVIEKCRLIPANKKMYGGTIEVFPVEGRYGIIDKEYIFYMNALQHSDNVEQRVQDGDRVIAEVISCSVGFPNYKTFGWRCIKIIKDTDQMFGKNVAAFPVSNEVEFEDNENEYGISITKSNELKVLFCGEVSLGQEKCLDIIVQNDSEEDHKINGVTFKLQNTGFQVACDEFNSAHTIPSKNAYTYTVTITSRIFGITYERIVFSFDGNFEIERCVKIEVAPGTNEKTNSIESAQKLAKHNKEYTKKLWNRTVDFQPGIRVKESPHFVAIRLKGFEVPKMLIDTVLETTTELNISAKLSEILPSFSPLQFLNYKRCFHALLYLEEIALDHEFRKYDRSCVHFTRENTNDGQYLALSMENVIESRPSIIAGDRIYAHSLYDENAYCDDANSKQNKHKTSSYEGFIHKVKQNRLLIKFHDSFHQAYNGEEYRLYFKFSRSQFIRQHNAIETINEPAILFPSKVNECDLLQLDVSLTDDGQLVSNYRNRNTILGWNNQKLNIIQKKAIECILRGEARSMPYIIFGPPGTGKTSTMVELILQLLRKVGGSRLIVCAPSNGAANIIVKRLIDSEQLKLGEFIRIVSQSSIERGIIPGEMLPYCAMPDIAVPGTTPDNKEIKTKSGLLLNANSVKLSGYKLLISTCSAFGSLMSMKFKRSHFTHVIIDEAGQCLESEAMIPISLLNKTNGQIILAGDPMQLGPIVTSNLAKDRGFGKSFLVRLLDRIPYTKYNEVI